MQNSKYSFTVRIKGKDTIEYENNGDTYIEGRKGSEYELIFKNKTYSRVLVVPSVDGLSTMDGKTASDKSSGYVVNGYQEIVIPGWKINSSKVAKFQFRPQNDKSNTTYVELLQEEGFDVDASNQGVIGCMVFEEVPKTYVGYPNYIPRKLTWIAEPYPYYDYGYGYGHGVGISYAGNLNVNNGYSPLRASGVTAGVAQMSMLSSSAQATAAISTPTMTMNYSTMDFMKQSSDLGTGFGADAKFETVSTEFEKKVSPDWIAVINYDTLQGLRKRGIFINHNPNVKAFPGYNEGGCYIPKNR